MLGGAAEGGARGGGTGGWGEGGRGTGGWDGDEGMGGAQPRREEGRQGGPGGGDAPHRHRHPAG